jgi:type VI secretion system VasD/TssJ family lipoprotein
MVSGGVFKRVIVATIAGVAVVLLATLSGCAGNSVFGGKPKFTLKVLATKLLNTSGTAVAYPLHYACIQLIDPAPLTGMTVEQLYGNWTSLPGGVFLSAGPEITIVPDSTRTEKPLLIDDRAGAIVVVGNFGKSSGSCFYYVQPVAGKKKKSINLDLTADSTCFVASPF